MSILTQNDKIIIRDYDKPDAETYIHWMTSGKWRDTDGPWWRDSQSKQDTDAIRRAFLEICAAEKVTPRNKALIATTNGKLIGRLNRYKHNGSDNAYLVGIAICEDKYIGKGMGTQILRLWVDYLFENSDIHRLGLETWSFNPRMIKVAEKAGFKLEGTHREVRHWRGQWLDLLVYGMLRSEWEGE